MPSVLRHRHFRNIWLAAFGSSTGTWMESVGVQWVMAEYAVEHAGSGAASAPAMMGYLAAAQLGPVLLLGLVGGLVADRANRKRLLITTQCAMMLVAACLAIASAMGWATPLVLLSLGLLNGVASAFNIPAWQVVFPSLVPRDELQKAITLNGMQFNFARVVGPALGGVMMALWGPTVLFVTNTVSFLGVMLAVWSVPGQGGEIANRKSINRKSEGVSAGVARESGAARLSPLSSASAALSPAPPSLRFVHLRFAISSLRESFAFTFGNPGPRAVFVALFLYCALAVPVIRFLPLFTSEVYHREERVYGLLLSLLGAGAVVGGFAVRLVPKWYPKHHFLPVALLCGSLSMAAFAFAPTLALAGPLLFLAGVFWLWTFTSGLSAVQLLAPDAMRGRVLSIFNTASFGATPIGALIMSVVGELTLRVAPVIASGAPTSNAPASGAASVGETVAGMGVSAAALGTQAITRAGHAVQWGVGLCALALSACAVWLLIHRTPEIDGLRPGDPGYERAPGFLRGLTARAHRPAREPDDRLADPEPVSAGEVG